MGLSVGEQGLHLTGTALGWLGLGLNWGRTPLLSAPYARYSRYSTLSALYYTGLRLGERTTLA